MMGFYPKGSAITVLSEKWSVSSSYFQLMNLLKHDESIAAAFTPVCYT